MTIIVMLTFFLYHFILNDIIALFVRVRVALGTTCTPRTSRRGDFNILSRPLLLTPSYGM